MTFSKTNAPLRTKVSFNASEDENHYKSVSPFVELNAGIVSPYPLNYKDVVCLRVVKHILLLWEKSLLRCILGSQNMNKISDSMISLRNYIPCESFGNHVW